MAPFQAIPLPPRTPTPPPEDNDLEGFSNSPTNSVFDPNSLSPMDENYPTYKYGSLGSLPTFTKTTLELGEADNMSVYSPMSVHSNGSGGGKCGSLMAEDSNGVFNFQPASMPKGPVVKSVRSLPPSLSLTARLSVDKIEHRTTAWTQVQTQQCVTSILP